MCLQQIPDPLRYYCWKEGRYVDEKSAEHQKCVLLKHDLEPEGFEETEKIQEAL